MVFLKSIRILFYFIVCFHLLTFNSHSINYYKYPNKDIGNDLCKKIYDSLNFPHPNYSSEEPIEVRVDIHVDRI